MKLLSNRRGQEQDIMFIALIIVFAAVLWLLLLAFVNNVSAESTYIRQFYAEDLGLVATGILSTSGNIQTVYEAESLKKFGYTFGEGEVKVEESGKTPVSVVYARDLAVPFVEEGLIENNPNRLVFVKDGNTIQIDTNERGLPIQRQCADENLNEKIIIVIPEMLKPLRDGIYSTNQNILLLESKVQAEGFRVEVAPRRGPMVINIPIEQDYEKAYLIACKIGNAVSKETGDPVIIKPVDITKAGIQEGIIVEADRTMHGNEIGKAIGRALK